MKSTTYTLGLVTLAGALVIGGAGFFGLVQGMPTRSLAPWAASGLLGGGVLLVLSLVLLGRGHSDAPPRFCNRCGEIVGAADETCSTCGHALV